MDALDLSLYEAAQDSPELKEYKKKVKLVADRYAKQNNWCGTVNKALLEMGIGTPSLVKIAVVIRDIFEFVVVVNLEEVLHKTVEEQRAVVVEKLGKLSLHGNDAVVVSSGLKFAADDITTMVAIPPDVVAETTLTIQHLIDQRWLYANGGRIRHHFPTTVGYRGVYYSSCGVSVYSVSPSSDMATDQLRLCKNCVRSDGEPTIPTEATA